MKHIYFPKYSRQRRDQKFMLWLRLQKYYTEFNVFTIYVYKYNINVICNQFVLLYIEQHFTDQNIIIYMVYGLVSCIKYTANFI